MTTPITYYCTGEALVPLRRFDNRFKSEFEKGKRYQMEEIEQRSGKSHRHFFASVAEAWSNLPEEYAQEFASPEHLRKYALIKTGWHDVAYFPFASKEEAMRYVTYHRARDEFAIVTINDNVVTIYTAKSQKSRGKDRMSNEDFQASKNDVLDYVWNLCGVDRETGERETGQAA